MIKNQSIFRKMPPAGEPIAKRKTTCPYCGKEITPLDAEAIDYVRQRGAVGRDIFFHTECLYRSSK